MVYEVERGELRVELMSDEALKTSEIEGEFLNRDNLRFVDRWVCRTTTEPMQVVSGPINRQMVYFEAPPSGIIPDEMKRFTEWINRTAPEGGVRRPH